MPDTDKQTVADGAAALRHAAIQDRYAGAGPPDTAFGLASVLDVLHVHWHDLDGELRAEVFAVCRALTTEGTCGSRRPAR
ncbi:hypothetical protein DMP17_22300 [Pseudonocardia sp. TMWB2A]|uniref:hypothetical protein n=1 Tax=Pseudonocardia sp. TMWB2A TaxID=687430 RepID=UPI00307EE771